MISGALAAVACCSVCGLVCVMLYLRVSTRGLIGAEFLFSRAEAKLFLRREIMRTVQKLYCHVHHQELPLAHRRILFFLLRLRGDVRTLLEPVSPIHPL